MFTNTEFSISEWGYNNNKKGILAFNISPNQP